MLLNFGDSGASAADGMAFVMHGDSRDECDQPNGSDSNWVFGLNHKVVVPLNQIYRRQFKIVSQLSLIHLIIRTGTAKILSRIARFSLQLGD